MLVELFSKICFVCYYSYMEFAKIINAVPILQWIKNEY